MKKIKELIYIIETDGKWFITLKDPSLYKIDWEEISEKEAKNFLNIKYKIGMDFEEWVVIRMDKQNITTARVFLITGAILGLLFGISITQLFIN